MADRIRVACVQLTSGREKASNLEKAEKLVAQAASTGADLVALPEKWNVIGPPETLHEAAETIDDGESVEAMRGWARTHGVERSSVHQSHQQLADATGLSKSAVQSAIKVLLRRHLVGARQRSRTATPEYVVHRPWADR